MYEIVSHHGVGDIAFGMTRADVHGRLGAPEKSFLKSPSSAMPTDVYERGALHVFYRPSDCVEAIEIFGPVEHSFRGVRLLRRPFREVCEIVALLDKAVEYEDAGLTSKALGIAIYAPSAGKDPDLPVEAVLAFEPGYYD